MSHRSAISTITPTLQTLITQKIKEKGFSRSQLVSAIGYTNISKGCKRLDTLLKTLEAPSDDFIITIASTLEIDPVAFCRALAASLDQFSADSKRTFKPYIEILLGIQIRPIFAAQMVRNQCSMLVPVELQNQPLSDEIEGITGVYKNHIATVLNDNLRKHVIGLRYNREHNYYMKFDADLTLEETVFIQPRPSGRVPFGNRVVDMLAGGMG